MVKKSAKTSTEVTVPNGTPSTEVAITFDDFVRNHWTYWKKSAEGVLEMCKNLVDADRSLPYTEFSRFLGHIGFNRDSSTFRKYMKIGDNYDRLLPHVKKLPRGWTDIYEIARLSPPDFDKVIGSDELHNEATLKTINKIIDRKKEKKSLPTLEGTTQYPSLMYEAAFIVYIHKTVDQTERNLLKRMLEDHGRLIKANDNGTHSVVGHKVVVRLAKEDRHLESGFVDRFSDQHGNPVKKDGQQVSETGVPDNDEISKFEPLARQVIDFFGDDDKEDEDETVS